MRRATVVGVMLVVLAGCGGGEEPAPAPTPSATTPAPEPTATTPAPVKLTGEPAPEALSGFRCEQISTGWAALGSLSNTGKQKASYQVTVYIGPADGAAANAITKRVADVAAGGSVQFRIDGIPVAGDGPCHVQVLRSDG